MERLWSLRGIILSLTAIIIVCIYFLTASTIPSPQLQVIRLSQIYAFLATIYLYAALLVSPLYTVFPYLPLRIWYTKARRAIGVSAFFFALIHTYFAFFGQLGGFSGLFYLSNNFLVPVLLGFTALTILLILTLTSFDKAIAHLTFTKWKKLHRTVYLAALISVIHALLLGTHYQDLSTLIPRITIALLAILLLLESIRFDRYLHKHFTQLPQCGIALTCTICLIIGYLVFSFAPSSSSVSFNVHAQHIQLAKQAQSGTLLPAQAKGIPGFNGDPTLRYTASFLPEPPVVANTPTKLTFKIYNAATGDEIKLFSRVYTKLIHLVIVNESLTYFSHIHPVQTDAGFEITTTFPKDDLYHLYIDYQPFGGIEQQMGFSLPVGDQTNIKKSTTPPDTQLTKVFGKYQVTMSYPKPLLAQQLSIGNQIITFTVKDAKTKQPITNLKPYLASFGHLVMINEQTFDYIHVHPNNLIPPPDNANGGPTVKFLPLGLYGPIKPGVYRVFAQFNPDNHLFTADFTLKIE